MSSSVTLSATYAAPTRGVTTNRTFSCSNFLSNFTASRIFLRGKSDGNRVGNRNPSKKIDNRGALISRQPSFFHRDCAGGDDSKAHRFSVQKFPVISGVLDCMANCMTEIQKRSPACAVMFVFRHDARFDLDVALDEPSCSAGAAPASQD